MHAVCTDDRPIAFFERHDGVVGLHTAGLSGTQGLGHNVGRGDDAGRPGRGREITSLLYGRVVVGELTNATGSHDVCARITNVEGEPEGSFRGAQDHDTRQGRAGGAHRIVGGRERGNRGGCRVNGNREINQIHGSIPEAFGTEELLQRDDGP